MLLRIMMSLTDAKQVIQYRKEKDYESCKRLTAKMEGMGNEYGIVKGNNYIFNLQPRHDHDCDNQINYNYRKYQWAQMYYTECDEFNKFVSDNNKKENGFKIVTHDKYVNFVRTHFDYKNETVTCNLERAGCNETRV
jgi:hypothetical protein